MYVYVHAYVFVCAYPCGYVSASLSLSLSVYAYICVYQESLNQDICKCSQKSAGRDVQFSAVSGATQP